MLRHLQIRDLVIVEQLELTLHPGLSALTGETGAGKSILLDALGLALGGRADRTLIRPGQPQAEVIAQFDLDALPAARAWLQAQALDDEDECILRRVIVREGRSRAFINGRPVPLRQLAELGAQLVQIHGQHEHQRLVQPAVQRRLLDGWGGHQALLDQVARHWKSWQDAARALEELRARERERAARLDYLGFQLEELRQAVPAPVLLFQSRHLLRRLANADRLAAGLAELSALIENEPQGLQGLLTQAAAGAAELAGDLLPELAPAAELLESARIQVDEALLAIRDQALGLEHDPARLAEVEARLGTLHDLARKHRVTVEELPALLETLEAELAELQGLESRLSELEEEHRQAREACLAACDRLHQARVKAARALSDEITERMQNLAMAGGRFEVAVETLPEEKTGAQGRDAVEFRVSANPGQPLAPLAKVASGGELSRIGLAIQVATASLEAVPTLIFDEVDTGIGGAVAETVGALLRELGSHGQVLCVTHLPQVAACAHHQYKVEKETDGRQTRTRIRQLDDAERIEEIARMVGGRRITDRTRAHAEQLIRQAS